MLEALGGRVANRWYGFVGACVAGAALGVSMRPGVIGDLDHAMTSLEWISVSQLFGGIFMVAALTAAGVRNRRIEPMAAVWVCGVAVGLIVTGADGLRLAGHVDALKKWSEHPLHEHGEKAVYTAHVLRGPQLGARGSTVEVRLEDVDGTPRAQLDPSALPEAVARVFLPADAVGETLPYPGDVIEFYAALETYPRQMLPGGWDGRQRMLRRGVVLRAVARGPWERT